MLLCLFLILLIGWARGGAFHPGSGPLLISSACGNSKPPSADQSHENDDDGDHQENVDEPAHGVGGDQTEQPKRDQDVTFLDLAFVTPGIDLRDAYAAQPARDAANGPAVQRGDNRADDDKGTSSGNGQGADGCEANPARCPPRCPGQAWCLLPPAF